MKYYTKEWYNLMQQMDYTCGMKKIPDKEYSDAEIREFYDRDLQTEIKNDRRIHNTPPSFDLQEELLLPENFRPEIFLIVAEDGKMFHPETSEIAREHLERDFFRQMESFKNRHPFDPTETEEFFKESYKNRLRYAGCGYPKWVEESVDKRFLALGRLPESVYNKLKKEERANKRAWERINKRAEADLSEQKIPEGILENICFHDANILSLRKIGKDFEMILQDGGFIGGETPYCRVIFKNIRRFDREKGLVIRTKCEEDGEYSSNMIYLYDEIYRTDVGFEMHMLLTGRKDLRYLTVECEDIKVEKSIIFSV